MRLIWSELTPLFCEKKMKLSIAMEVNPTSHFYVYIDIQVSGGHFDLQPCLTRTSAIAPTLAPVVMERTMTTRAASSVWYLHPEFSVISVSIVVEKTLYDLFLASEYTQTTVCAGSYNPIQFM